MPIQRDPKTGEVIAAGVDPHQNKYTEHAEYGEIRRAFRSLLAEERKMQASLTPSGPRPMPEFRLGDTLLVEDKKGGHPTETCPNSHGHLGMWVGSRRTQVLEALSPPQWPLLNRLAHLCREAQVRRCTNPTCLRNRQSVQKAAPHSRWKPFYEWAITVVCCEVSCTPAERLRRSFFHLVAAANSCHWLLVEYKNGRKEASDILLGPRGEKDSLDLFAVCEIVYWLVTVQSSLGLNDVLEGRWGPEFLSPSITDAAVDQAAAEAQKKGICRDRLWNIALVSDRKQVDLPCLMEAVAGHAELKHPGHERCIVGFCHAATVDSTKVHQLHRPKGKHDCELLYFDPDLLVKSVHSRGRTTWTIAEPYAVAQDQPYVAISHVWSDGTGIGIQRPGEVNECLFNYMANVTRRLDCDALWWDTISIPMEPVARREAINDMHLNYSAAKYTVLHDNYLLNHKWSEDGSPCIAIVFSPWLTRGWTALELIMSRRVKVLFKGPTEQEPVIKDLDDDILAKDPARCTRAHWIASTIIRRLRRPIDNVTDLMAVLKPRSTSWPRDRMIIAGLLSGLKFKDYNVPQDEITKAIVDRVVRINPCSLLHGKETITQSGGWSWCPPSLYDMPADTVVDLFEQGTIGDKTCVVDKNGVLAGAWFFRPIEENEVTEGRIASTSSQLSVTTKVKTALRRWQYCMLLRESPHTEGPAILVTPQGRDRDFIHCKFIGSVHVHEPSTGNARRTERSYHLDFFKIGKENKDIPATSFLKSQTPHADEDYKWLHQKLWISDVPFFGGLLVTKSNPKRGITKGYLLDTEEPSESDGRKLQALSNICPDKCVFPCLAEVVLSQRSTFRVRSDSSSQTGALKRIADTHVWPPETIPTRERTGLTNKIADMRGYSENLFSLNGLPSGPATFAAIDSALYTPDAQHKYRGVWMGFFPGHGYEFLLFHQPTETRLEAIKLTGDRSIPRGAHFFIVEGLGKVKSSMSGESFPVVAAKAQIANEGYINPMFIDVDLHLVSENEVLIAGDLTLRQIIRVYLEPYLSTTDARERNSKRK